MKLTTIAIVCATVVTATPYPWARPQAADVAVASTRPHDKYHKLNRTKKNPHKEPTPTFKLACNCAKPIVPVNLLTANEVSHLVLVESPTERETVE